MREFAVVPGDVVKLTASHDTYSIAVYASGGMPTAMPPSDGAWDADFQALARANDVLMRAIAQSPLEYRCVATAAARLAARPGDAGIDGEAAASFLQRLM